MYNYEVAGLCFGVIVEMEMKSLGIKEFPIEYIKIINLLNNFFDFLEDWSVEKYIEQCEDLVQCLEESSEEEIKNLNLACVCNSDLLHMKAEFSKKNNEEQIVHFTQLVYHSYAIKKKFLEKEDLYTEQANRITEVVQNYYFDNLRYKQEDYYKNLFEEKYYEEYEGILCLIRNELKIYDMNLVYCKKIIDFLTNEFEKKGIYITQTIFLRNYLNNTVDSMILAICKMFLDAPDTGKKKNCGISYLQSYIGKNLSRDNRKIVQEKLRDAGDKIKKVKKIADKLESLRNSLIAHFDIKEIESVKEIKMGIEEFESVFDLSCEILELLSMKYFLYENKFSHEMIDIHGFKSFVCQDPLLHNPNPMGKTDLDIYFDALRKDFVKK